MSLMNGVVHSFLDSFVIVLIDDILVYSRSEEEHTTHICTFLVFLGSKIYMKIFFKCEFRWKSMVFLGKVLPKEGVRVDHQKIEEVKNWVCPGIVSWDSLVIIVFLLRIYLQSLLT